MINNKIKQGLTNNKGFITVVRVLLLIHQIVESFGKWGGKKQHMNFATCFLK